jgi:hypothetical protein
MSERAACPRLFGHCRLVIRRECFVDGTIDCDIAWCVVLLLWMLVFSLVVAFAVSTFEHKTM